MLFSTTSVLLPFLLLSLSTPLLASHSPRRPRASRRSFSSIASPAVLEDRDLVGGLLTGATGDVGGVATALGSLAASATTVPAVAAADTSLVTTGLITAALPVTAAAAAEAASSLVTTGLITASAAVAPVAGGSGVASSAAAASGANSTSSFAGNSTSSFAGNSTSSSSKGKKSSSSATQADDQGTATSVVLVTTAPVTSTAVAGSLQNSAGGRSVGKGGVVAIGAAVGMGLWTALG